jgi:hypothetical protein
MAWYDYYDEEEEQDPQDPFSSSPYDYGQDQRGPSDYYGTPSEAFGVPIEDYSRFDPTIQQQQDNPLSWDPTEANQLMDMKELYDVPQPKYTSDAMEQYGKYVQEEPKRSDYKSKWWQQLAGGFIGGLDATQRGVAAGRQSREAYLDAPYNKDRAEWANRAKQMAELARIETQRNNLERQRYGQEQTAARGRVNARRLGRLGVNTLQNSVGTRALTGSRTRLTDARTRTEGIRADVLPLRTFTSDKGDLTRYDIRNPQDPLTRGIVGRSAADTPEARTTRARILANNQMRRQQWASDDAWDRLESQQRFTREENEKYRDPADKTGAGSKRRPASDISNEMQNQLNQAYESPDFDNLRRTGALGAGESGNDIVLNMEIIDDAINEIEEARARKQKVDPESDAWKIFEEWMFFKRKYKGR